MKTPLRLLIASLALLAAACGGTEVDGSEPGDDNAFEQDPPPTPEVPPDVTPEPTPTPVPNQRPFVPVFSVSDDSVKAQALVTLDLALVDPDMDPLTSDCHAFVTSAAPELPIDGFLSKLSETRWTLLAPITESDMGEVAVRCTATDDAGETSDEAEVRITIDNHDDGASNPPAWNKYDICRMLKSDCVIEILNGFDVMSVRVPQPEEHVPDQVRRGAFELPHTDFVSHIDVSVNLATARAAVSQGRAPSLQMSVGSGELGSGYLLELIPTQTGIKFPLESYFSWHWQVRALANDGLTAGNLFAGTILASGQMGTKVPTRIEARMRDGLLQFIINDTFVTPAIATSNMSGTVIGYSARSVDASFLNSSAVLKP